MKALNGQVNLVLNGIDIQRVSRLKYVGNWINDSVIADKGIQAHFSKQETRSLNTKQSSMIVLVSECV